MLILVTTAGAAAFTVFFVKHFDNPSELYRFAPLVENFFAYTLQHLMFQSEILDDQKTLKLKTVRGNPT